MDENQTNQVNPEEGLKEQVKEYKKLQAIADSEEFKNYFDYQLRIVTDKMLWGFSTTSISSPVNPNVKITKDNISSWDEFCKWRGEILARLQPIQEICGSEAVIQHLNQTLDNYYKKQVA